MYVIIGIVSENRMSISSAHRFLNDDEFNQAISNLPEGHTYLIVETFEVSPSNPNPDMYYVPYYDLVEEVIKFEEYPRPLTPEERSEQRMTTLEQTLDTLILSALEV